MITKELKIMQEWYFANLLGFPY